MNEIRKRDPQRSLLYLSDSGAVPYGKMTRGDLARRVGTIAARMAGLGIRNLVVACNAASTVLPDLTLDLQVTGVIEHGLAMVEKGDYQKVGILGGQRTILSQSYARTLRRSGRTVVGRVAQPLSALIEKGEIESAAMDDLLCRLLLPLRSMDAVVLACTHYPAVRPQIQALLPGVELVDPAEGAAEWVVKEWGPHPRPLSRLPPPDPRERGEKLTPASCLPSPGGGVGGAGRGAGVRAFTTGDPDSMRHAAARAFGNRLETVESWP